MADESRDLSQAEKKITVVKPEQTHKVTTIFTQDYNFVHPGKFWLLFFEFTQLYMLGMKLNISSVVEFQRWWVLKSKLFGQESTCHQGKIFKKILRVMTVCQKVPKSYFQSQFWISKINRTFSKKILSKNINLGDHYLLIFFFLNSIFEPLYFLKLCPIFDRLSLLVGIF